MRTPAHVASAPVAGHSRTRIGVPSAAATVRVVLDTPGIVRDRAGTLRSVTARADVDDRILATQYPFYDQNIGVVLGDEAALVVDTRVSHRQAAEILADL